MKLAFLYAGQGSQKVGMGKDLYEDFECFRQVIDNADKELNQLNGMQLKKIMFQGPEDELKLTKNTQPSMVSFAVGVTNILKDNNIIPEAVAGLSLGEYSALYASGVLDCNEVIKAVAFRGEEMQKASEGIECEMLAIIGLDKEKVIQICEKATAEAGEIVSVTNYNCTGQYVIGGVSNAIEIAKKYAKEVGGKRCIPLNVSGPFHTLYMEPASKALEKYFTNLEFKPMEIPIIFNTTADVLKKDEHIQDLLIKQVKTSVNMEDSIKKLAEMGIDTIIEIGPGKVLSGFVKRTVSGIQVYTAETSDDIRNIIESI